MDAVKTPCENGPRLSCPVRNVCMMALYSQTYTIPKLPSHISPVYNPNRRGTSSWGLCQAMRRFPTAPSRSRTDLLPYLLHYLHNRRCRWTIWKRIQEALAIIGTHPNPWVQRHFPQKRDAFFPCQPRSATRRRLKYLGLVRTTRTDEARHVFHDAENADVGFAAEINLLADIEEGDFLRGGN